MKLAAAQINTTACDVAGNIEKIVSAWKKADAQGVELVVTPEQSISGYPLEDMARNPDVLAASREGLEHLVKLSAKMKSGIVVGLPEVDEEGNIYNAAYVIDQGKIVDRVRKQELPNYDVFDEVRIYTPGPRTEPVEFRGHRLGLMICEDIWHPHVARDLTEKGAEVLIVTNASPFHEDKQTGRIDLLQQRILEEGNNLPVLYVNQVGGQDEIVFDGYSCAMNADGKTAMMAPCFEETLEVMDLDFDKRAFTGAKITERPGYHAEVWQALVTGTRDYLNKVGFTDVVLGMSGGIDSAVVAAIAADALGPEHVHLYKLPSEYSSEHSIKDADDAAKMLGSPIDSISIDPVVAALRASSKPFFNASAKPEEVSLADENLQARARGTILMTLSNANRWMLLSTGNKSEVSVGYCTLYGDMNGGFNPLKDVPKMLVYALAEWRNENRPSSMLGSNGPVVPENIITKKPSAELRPDQFDDESLPPYPVLDDILKRYVEMEQSIANIVKETGYENDLVKDIVAKVDRAEFKRRQACPGIKITERSFGKGRRVPIVRPSVGWMQKQVSGL
ncbi:MAG: NAD+ synthase [Alphaproteobacteria bacterium]|nr:NAD+ synthase [Alphaproteobacteria bacterium]